MQRTNRKRFRLLGPATALALIGGGAADARAEAPEGWEVEENPSGDDDFELEEADHLEPEAGEEEVPQVDDSAFSPAEKPGETYYFVGGRYRALVVPQFMINLFADGGQTFVVHGAGAEFGIRQDNFEILPAIWFANYSFDAAPFKGKNDGADAWELVDGNLKVLYLTVDFLWSTPINDQFAINYGAGAGLGLVFGHITRNEAYFPGGLPGNADGSGLVPCGAPGAGPDGGQQCPIDGEYNQRDDAWPVFPWLAVQTGLRYKPHRSFVARLDLGFSTSGVFFGLGADYGL